MNKDVPPLEGWTTLAEAANLLGVTRQYCHRLSQQGFFSSLRRVGTSATLVVATEEVHEKKALRKNLK